MAVRNFWIEADIEGRKTTLASGPRAKGGGFTLRIYIRNKGDISLPLKVEGIAHDDGRLELVTFLDEHATREEGGGFVLTTKR